MNQLDLDLIKAKEIFASLGEITTRKMFGGGGIYCDGLIFALVDEGKFYLKCDEINLSEFESAGMGPFYYQKESGVPVAMKYFEMPPSAYDNQIEAANWGKLGIEAQQRAQLKALKKKPRAPKNR